VEKQKADPNPFPEVKLFRCPPPFEGIARAIASIRSLGTEVELCLTEHPPKSDILDV